MSPWRAASFFISKRKIIAGFPIMKCVKIFSRGKGEFQIKGVGGRNIPQQVKFCCNFPKQRKEWYLLNCSAPP